MIMLVWSSINAHTLQQVAAPELALKSWGIAGATDINFMLFKMHGWYLATGAAAVLSRIQVHLSLSLSR